jgi:hypothetical protein
LNKREREREIAEYEYENGREYGMSELTSFIFGHLVEVDPYLTWPDKTHISISAKRKKFTSNGSLIDFFFVCVYVCVHHLFI